MRLDFHFAELLPTAHYTGITDLLRVRARAAYFSAGKKTIEKGQGRRIRWKKEGGYRCVCVYPGSKGTHLPLFPSTGGAAPAAGAATATLGGALDDIMCKVSRVVCLCCDK